MSRKKLSIGACVAAAMLCPAGAAYAQSSVTLYGIVDAGLMYLSHSTPTFNGTATSTKSQVSLTNGGYLPSLWGIKGEEDLGGGMKAVFNLESGFSVANGGHDSPANNSFFNRLAYVGLKGGFGTLSAGLQYSPFFNAMYDLDPRGVAQFGSVLTPLLDNSLVAAIIMPNAVSYSTPNLGGFEANGLFGLGGVAGSFQNGRSYSLSARYTNGTILLTTAYLSVNNALNPTLPPDVFPLLLANVRAWTAGGSYKFGSATVKASFTNFRANEGGQPTTVSSTNTNVNLYSAGADYFVLPQLDVNLGMYYQDDRVNSGVHSLTAALGAQYLLSRRTALYAQVGLVHNTCSGDGACLGSGLTVENLGSGVGAMKPIGNAGLPAGTTFGANVGMRVMF